MMMKNGSFRRHFVSKAIRSCDQVRKSAKGPRSPVDQVAHFWRALGFPDPSEGEEFFTATDLGTYWEHAI